MGFARLAESERAVNGPKPAHAGDFFHFHFITLTTERKRQNRDTSHSVHTKLEIEGCAFEFECPASDFQTIHETLFAGQSVVRVWRPRCGTGVGGWADQPWGVPRPGRSLLTLKLNLSDEGPPGSFRYPDRGGNAFGFAWILLRSNRLRCSQSISNLPSETCALRPG